MAAVRARRSLDEADPYLPAGPGAHLRSGAEMATLFARYPTAVPNAAAHRRGVLVRPAPGRAEAAALRRAARSRRELLAARAHHARRRPALRLAGRATPDAYAQIENELRIIAKLELPRLLPDRARHRPVLPRAPHPVPGQGFGRQLRGLLRARHHRGRRGAATSCCSSGSSRRSGTARRTSTSTSSPTGARRSSSTSTTRTAATHAAQVANVNTFRPRMAVRDMAKALGHSPGQQDAYSKQLDGWSPLAAQLQAPTHRASRPDVLELAGQIQDYPRHLGIHSGGMVICDRPVAQVCPVEWARMENRSVLQWDKDDCAAIGLVKFDLLGPRHALRAALRGRPGPRARGRSRSTSPGLDLEEPAVYEMLQRADSVGVFQVESRAQMATLPRLKPRTFYDLVVEVALIRPGPIQGGSVHPYIRRRNGLEPVTYDHPVMERSLRQDAGHPAVPGAADAAGGGRRRVRRRRGRPAAPGDGRQAVHARRWRS